jgi:hypothetical protein
LITKSFIFSKHTLHYTVHTCGWDENNVFSHMYSLLYVTKDRFFSIVIMVMRMKVKALTKYFLLCKFKNVLCHESVISKWNYCVCYYSVMTHNKSFIFLLALIAHQKDEQVITDNGFCMLKFFKN